MAGGGFDAGGFAGGLVGAGASLLGGLMGQQSAEDIANENIQYQEDFAKNGIQWRVADARAAGINPLAALGASTTSFSNVVGSDDLGKGVSQAGQDLGRAMKSTMSHDDQAYVDASNALTLENMKLKNDYIGMQIAASKQRLLNQPGDGAPTPTPASIFDTGGQPVAGTSAQNFPPLAAGMPGLSSRVIPGSAVTGDEAVLPSRETGQAGFFPIARWQEEMRNTVLPTFGYWGPNDKRNWTYGVNPATGRPYKLHDVWDRGDWIQNITNYEPSMWNNN